MIQNIRKNEFESLIKSSKPVLADFYAEWCSPCRMLSPVIEEIGDKYKAYFKDGNEILRMSGVQTEERIISAISEKTGESFV